MLVYFAVYRRYILTYSLLIPLPAPYGTPNAVFISAISTTSMCAKSNANGCLLYPQLAQPLACLFYTSLANESLFLPSLLRSSSPMHIVTLLFHISQLFIQIGSSSKLCNAKSTKSNITISSCSA